MAEDIQTTRFNKIFSSLDFIPAAESKPFIFLFRWYTRLLFKRRFADVWIRQEYHPDDTSKTVYYLNHHSWWDGLIPFLLNEFCFRQNARALMEERQMKRYRFFRKIGAFSVNRSDPRKSITSLRYAVQSMNRPKASLYIYPEGEITPAGSELHFEDGLGWLHSKVDRYDVDFVPLGIYMHCYRTDKPELYLYVGKAAEPHAKELVDKRTRFFEQRLQQIVDTMEATAGFDDEGFERFL